MGDLCQADGLEKNLRGVNAKKKLPTDVKKNSCEASGGVGGGGGSCK